MHKYLCYLLVLTWLSVSNAGRHVKTRERAVKKPEYVQQRFSMGGTKQQSTVKTAAKRDESAQAAVQFLDSLASESQSVTSFDDCAVTKQPDQKDCRVAYKPTGVCSFFTVFKGLFKDLSESKMASVMSSGISRNLFQANKFSFSSTSTIVVDACTGKKKLLLRDFTAATVSPLPWLMLESVSITRAFVFYGQLSELENVDDWIQLGFEGTATADIKGNQATVGIKKQWQEKQIGDSDVVLSINTEQRSIPAVSFLSWLKQTPESLYPEAPDVNTFSMQIEDATVEKKGDDAMIKVILGNNKLWDAYVTGQTSGSNLLNPAKKLYIYCKNGDFEQFSKVSCAVMAKFQTGTFKWDQVTNGFDVESMASERPIVQSMKENGDLYFQSSRYGIQNPSDEGVSEEFSQYANIEEAGKNVATDNYVTEEMCVRFFTNTFNREFPELVSERTVPAMIVHACPHQDNVRFHFPSSAPNAIFKYAGIETLVVNGDGPEFGIRDDANVKVKEMKITSSNVCESFSPEPVYQMLDGNDAVALKEITFTQCFDGNTWSFSAAGKGSIFGALSDLKELYNANGIGLTGTLNIFDSQVLQSQTDAKYLGINFQGTFGNLMNFPMKDFKFEGLFNNKKVLHFKGKAKIHGHENINAEFIYYLNEQTKKHDLALCLKLEGHSIEGLLGYIYNTEAIGASPWIRYDTIVLIARKSREYFSFERKFCKDAENRYDLNGFTVGTTKAFKGGILFYADNIKFPDCGVQDQEIQICKFYQRIFGGNSLTIRYYGQARADKSFFVEGRFETPIELGPGIEIRGKLPAERDTEVGKIVHVISMAIKKNAENQKDEVQGKNELVGTLWLEDVEANFPVKLILTGESVMFNVPQMEGSSALGTNILGVPNVKSSNIRSASYPLDLSKPIEEVEFHSRLFIGSSNENAITIVGGRENNIQYIHGRGKAKNKFCACKPSGKSMILRNVFAAFGITYDYRILKGSFVEDPCFTYHAGKEEGDEWDVPNRDFKVKPGLRLTAKLRSTFGNNMPLSILFEENAVKMLVQLPPIRWGVSVVPVEMKNLEGELVSVEKKMTRIHVTATEEEESFGPQMYMEYQSGVFTEGCIEGYFRTTGFAGSKRMKIMANEDGKVAKYELSYQGSIYGAIEGQLKLTADYDGPDINEIGFHLDVDVLAKVKELIPPLTQKSVAKFSEPHDRVLNKLVEDIESASRHHQTSSSKQNEITEEINSLSTQAKRSRIERTRSIHASSRQCARECKPVHVPGLKWEKKCTTSRKQQDSRCLKFSKRAHTVSDVGCVAQCESERVRSHVEAKHHDNVARSNIAKLADTTLCKNMASKLVQKVRGVKTELEQMKTELTEPSKFIRDLNNAVHSDAANVIKIASIKSSYPIIEAASEPECLKFRFGYQIITSDDDTMKEMNIEDSLCFGGSFAESVAEFTLREAYKSEYSMLQGLLDNAEEQQARVLATFADDVVKEKEAIELCLRNAARNSAEEGSEKRGYVPTAKLPPLRSSLFHVLSDRTVLMFDKYSPWSVLERNDPFSEELPAVERTTIEDAKPKDSCTAARQTVQNYQDITDYIKAWATSQQSGMKSLGSIPNVMRQKLTAVRSVIDKLSTNELARAGDVKKMSLWMNVTENGMKRWLDLSTYRLNRLDKEGIKLIKNELSYMYSDNEYKSIDDFLKKTATKGNNAFKRAIISGKNEKPFSKLSQELLHILQEGNSLRSILPAIEKIDRKISKVDKRSISCIGK